MRACITWWWVRLTGWLILYPDLGELWNWMELLEDRLLKTNSLNSKHFWQLKRENKIRDASRTSVFWIHLNIRGLWWFWLQILIRSLGVLTQQIKQTQMMPTRVMMKGFQFTIYPPGEGHIVWLGNLLWNKWLAPQNNWNGTKYRTFVDLLQARLGRSQIPLSYILITLQLALQKMPAVVWFQFWEFPSNIYTRITWILYQ